MPVKRSLGYAYRDLFGSVKRAANFGEVGPHKDIG